MESFGSSGLVIDEINRFSRGMGYGMETEIRVRLYGELIYGEDALRKLGDDFVEQLAAMIGVPLTVKREEITGEPKPKPKKKRASGAKRRKKKRGNNSKPKPKAPELKPGQRAIEY